MRGIRDHIRALKHVRRHQQIAREDPPSFRLEGLAYTRRAGESIMHRARGYPLLAQCAKDEWEQSGFVADIPHDAKRARFLASPSDTDLAGRYGHCCAGGSTVTGFVGIAKPYLELSASAAAFAIS